jgi:hypothetical protein
MKKTGSNCLYCKKPLFGRSDKKYCDGHCKSAFDYEARKQNTNLYYKIDRQLKKNRRLLRKFNQDGRTLIEKTILLKEGFDPNYFTHYWKNNKEQVFLFCYEYGFLLLQDQGKSVYLLEHWNAHRDENS